MSHRPSLSSRPDIRPLGLGRRRRLALLGLALAVAMLGVPAFSGASQAYAYAPSDDEGPWDEGVQDESSTALLDTGGGFWGDGWFGATSTPEDEVIGTVLAPPIWGTQTFPVEQWDQGQGDAFTTDGELDLRLELADTGGQTTGSDIDAAGLGTIASVLGSANAQEPAPVVTAEDLLKPTGQQSNLPAQAGIEWDDSSPATPAWAGVFGQPVQTVLDLLFGSGGILFATGGDTDGDAPAPAPPPPAPPAPAPVPPQIVHPPSGPATIKGPGPNYKEVDER